MNLLLAYASNSNKAWNVNSNDRNVNNNNVTNTNNGARPANFLKDYVFWYLYLDNIDVKNEKLKKISNVPKLNV